MKTVVATLLALGSMGGALAHAQAVDIDDLRAPTSPAFVLLDVTPASVERPENPKAFTVNLIKTFARADGLPQNYALEVAPYWLTYHPTLTFAQYQSPGARSLIQTLAISVATTPMTPADDTSADPIGTRLGLGVRTNITNGRFDPTMNTKVEELAALQGRLLDVGEAEDAVTNAEADLASARSAGRATADLERTLKEKQEALAALKAEEPEIENDLMMKALEIQALDAQRVGLIVTIAAGKTWDFPEDDFSLRQPGRWGVWVTPTYRFRACTASGAECTAVVDAIAVVRALRDPGKETSWDVGGRMVWQPTRELKLSGEILRRWAGESTTGPAPAVAGDSNRTTAMLEYQIRRDLSLYASFGRDFEKDTGQKPLVSLMGLNIGLGKKPSVMASMPTP
jgi:hypothetical protein